MLNVSKQSPNRIDIELSGALDADAMRSGLDHLIEKSEGITNGKMLYRPLISLLTVGFEKRTS